MKRLNWGTVNATSPWPGVFGCQLEERAANQLAHSLTEIRALRDLSLHRESSRVRAPSPRSSSEHRLADTPQASYEHGLLGMATAQAIKEYLEGLQLAVAPNQSWRTGAGIGGVGVVVGPHRRDLIRLIKLYRNLINHEKVSNLVS
jgi:hypothetical protein